MEVLILVSFIVFLGIINLLFLKVDNLIDKVTIDQGEWLWKNQTL